MSYLDEIKRDRLIDRINTLLIVNNPHTKKPEKLLKDFTEELKNLSKGSIIDSEDELPEQGAFDKLRGILGSKNRKK